MQQLVAYRAQRRLTQRALAEMAGVRHGTITRAEKGLSVNVVTMHKIAQALGVTPDDITEFYHQLRRDHPRVPTTLAEETPAS